MDGSLRDGKAAAEQGTGPGLDQRKTKSGPDADADPPSQARIGGRRQGQTRTNCRTKVSNMRARCGPELAKWLSSASMMCRDWWAASDGGLRDGKAATVLGSRDDNGKWGKANSLGHFFLLAPVAPALRTGATMIPNARGAAASLRVCKAGRLDCVITRCHPWRLKMFLRRAPFPRSAPADGCRKTTMSATVANPAVAVVADAGELLGPTVDQLRTNCGPTADQLRTSCGLLADVAAGLVLHLHLLEADVGQRGGDSACSVCTACGLHDYDAAQQALQSTRTTYNAQVGPKKMQMQPGCQTAEQHTKYD